MPTQTWRVVVTKLGGSDVIGEVEVDAANWMGALRVGRERLGEAPTMPAGASCSVDGSGTATVLDPTGRRKLMLTPIGPAKGTSAAPAPRVSAAPSAAVSQAPSAPSPAPSAASPAAAPSAASPAAAPSAASPAAAPSAASPAAAPSSEGSPSMSPAKKRKRFETVAFVPGHLAAAMANSAAQQPPPSAPAPAPVAAPEPTKSIEARPAAIAPVAVQAPAAVPAPTPAAAVPTSAVAPARASQPHAPAASVAPAGRVSEVPSTARASHPSLEMIFDRAAEPTPDNPISYRERAYFLPRGVSVQEAEAALRFELVAMQAALRDARRGKLVNLAAFDHHWKDAPERPPIVALQWRDWRGEAIVDFPATRLSAPPSAPVPARSEPPAAHDDRLDEVFQGLAELSRLRTPVEGLDLAMHLLQHHVASEALSACLYDINTDELRFVSVVGTGAAEAQGKAIPRSAGLFGQALRNEHRCTVFGDVLLEPAFSPEVDARIGLDARSMLLCPIVSEGHLLGALQLTNRRGAFGYSQADSNVVGYVAERIGEFLHGARQRMRSEPPPPPPPRR